MKIPSIKKLKLPRLIDAASHLTYKGNTKLSDNNLFYLKIDDAFIHRLFPLLKDESIKKPDYFGEKSAGAHITICYPEEGVNINKNDLAKEHNFLIDDVVATEINQKLYYVLLAQSSSLLQLRRNYTLPDRLCFKGYSIGFHVTIGVKI